jgi:hypothetical protein
MTIRIQNLPAAAGERQATMARRLTTEADFDVVDAGLERRHLLLQLGQIAREDLAATALVGEARLDPAQSLDDRLILLLEPLKPPVDLVEMANISRRSSAMCSSTLSNRRSTWSKRPAM